MPHQSHNTLPVLVGHRGFPSSFPENSLAGIEAAINAGALYIECDVQMSSDHQLVLLHDATLARTAGIDSYVFNRTQAELSEISVHEPARLGDRFKPTPLPVLDDALAMLPADDNVTLLVEIKQESLDHFGLEFVMTRLSEQLKPYTSHVIVISYNDLAIEWLREHSDIRIGWVLEQYRKIELDRARELEPDLLLGHHKLIQKDTQLWQGNWRWMLHGIEDLELAKALRAKGVHYVETDNIGGLIAASHI